MTLRVRTLAIKRCGCGFEGSIRFLLLESGIEVSCSYTAQNDEAVEASYRIGLEADAPIFLAYGAIQKSSCRTAGIHPNVVGKFAGWITVDGDELAVVDSLFSIPVDNELGNAVPDLKPGDWVECTGELTLRHQISDDFHDHNSGV